MAAMAGALAVALAVALALAASLSGTAFASSARAGAKELGVSEESTIELPAPRDGSDKFERMLLDAVVADEGVFTHKAKRKAEEGAEAFAPSEAPTGSAQASQPSVMGITKKADAPAAQKGKPKVADPSGEWKTARVSWYGPGLYGNTMAGGGRLAPDSMVVAHRSLPFGTKIEFSYNGHTVIAVVQDRGPYVRNRVFDLGPGTAQALGFSGVDTVEYRIVR